jgi:hypothetical protein
MSCAYIVQVWKDMEDLASLKDVYVGNSNEKILKSWCNNPALKRFKALPLIID